MDVTGRNLRISRIINKEDNRSLIIEMDKGFMLGPVPGLSKINETLQQIPYVDGIVLTLGALKRTYHHFKGRDAPSLIIRSDWTNLFRGTEHILPSLDINHILVAEAEDTAIVDGMAAISYFLIGYDKDADEARNMEDIAKLSKDCMRFSLPLIIQVIPFGPRITKENRYDCIRLAARMAMEVGADIITVPFPNTQQDLEDLVHSIKIPLLIWDRGFTFPTLKTSTQDALDAGATGVIVGEGIFTNSNWLKHVEQLHGIIHK